LRVAWAAFNLAHGLSVIVLVVAAWCGVVSLRVWAPEARSVELLVGARRTALEAGEGGYWKLPDATLLPGTDYWLSVNGGPPTPDPRSPSQPHGVHAASRSINLADFKWEDADFRAAPLSEAVIYELHVGTFTAAGTFEAAIERLAHLVELGVTHVELMPVCEFSGERGWGYDGVSLFAPHHTYGGPEGLQRFVAACHRRGLGVILDVVYNHVGPRGNYLPRFGPYFLQEGTPWGAAVNLRGPHSDGVRRFFIDNALMWLQDYHFDGLRLDAVQAFRDDGAFPFLAELAWEVRRAGERAGKEWILIAECDRSDPRTTRELNAGGLGMSAQWSDEFQFAIHSLLTGEHNGRLQDFGQLTQLAAVLEHGFWLRGQYSHFRGRSHGHPLDEPELGRLLGYLQTHDQVGNRPGGDRLSHLVSWQQLQAASALLLLGPFVPMLFQGEEWAASTPFFYFTDHEDAALGRDVKLGREREYAELGFDPSQAVDPQAPEAFTRSKLRWEELQQPEHHSVLDFYQALIALRRATPDFAQLPVDVRFDPDARWLLLDRGVWAVAVNFLNTPQNLSLRAAPELKLSAGSVALRGAELELGAHALAILRFS